jgi:hypothetical protein
MKTPSGSAVRLKKSPENYKHTQGHSNKGDAPLLRKTAGESTSYFLGIGQEIPFAGIKEYLLVSCKPYLHCNAFSIIRHAATAKYENQTNFTALLIAIPL